MSFVYSSIINHPFQSQWQASSWLMCTTNREHEGILRSWSRCFPKVAWPWQHAVLRPGLPAVNRTVLTYVPSTAENRKPMPLATWQETRGRTAGPWVLSSDAPNGGSQSFRRSLQILNWRYEGYWRIGVWPKHQMKHHRVRNWYGAWFINCFKAMVGGMLQIDSNNDVNSNTERQAMPMVQYSHSIYIIRTITVIYCNYVCFLSFF